MHNGYRAEDAKRDAADCRHRAGIFRFAGDLCSPKDDKEEEIARTRERNKGSPCFTAWPDSLKNWIVTERSYRLILTIKERGYL